MAVSASNFKPESYSEQYFDSAFFRADPLNTKQSNKLWLVLFISATIHVALIFFIVAPLRLHHTVPTQVNVELVEDQVSQEEKVEPKVSVPRASSTGVKVNKSASQNAANKPQPSGAPEAKAINEEWRRVISEKIKKYLVYPSPAKLMHISGTVLVDFMLDDEGQVISANVVASSGSSILDNDAIATLKKAAPFGRLPKGVAKQHTLPIVYRLN